jgi:AGZA family xanthine/uracil permease-like MFS transporter
MFGLAIDNAAALSLLYILLAAPGFHIDRFTASFVLTWLIPGTVAGVLLGGLCYAFMAQRLAKRTGRRDVTAMPVGLDTPTVFAMSQFVLLPTLTEGWELFANRGLNEMDRHYLASVFAWHVGAIVLVVMGVLKTMLAPLGNLVRSWLPRAALLGSLAAVALALIAFLPVSRHIAAAPVVGLPVLAVILVTLLARRGTQNAIPGSVLALGVGLVIVLVSIFLGEWRGWEFTPLSEPNLLVPGPVPPLPAEMWTADWWGQAWSAAIYKLPLALPFALFTLVGGVQCAESSAAAGDEYDTRGVLLVQGAATTVAGLLGGVVQTTPYFGHPAYKKMGAGWTYALVGTLAIALAGYFGWFAHFFQWVPGPVLFPVIVYIGLRTIAHSYEASPPRDYAALAFAAVPVLSYLIVISADEIFRGRTPNASGVVLLQALRCLGNGFILTSLFWAVAITAILDGRPRRGAGAFLLAAVCSLVGLIHSPLPGAPLAWPHEVWQQLVSSPIIAVRYQSPFHWAAAYVLAAGVLLIDSWLRAKPVQHQEPASSFADSASADGGITSPEAIRS